MLAPRLQPVVHAFLQTRFEILRPSTLEIAGIVGVLVEPTCERSGHDGSSEAIHDTEAGGSHRSGLFSDRPLRSGRIAAAEYS